MGYERRSTSAVKEFFHLVFGVIFGLAMVGIIIFVCFLVIKDQEKRENITTCHAAVIEYKQVSNYHYVYVKNEEGELIELRVEVSAWKDLKVGDTIVYKKTEHRITENEETKILSIDYDY